MSFLITIVIVEFVHEVKYFLSILSKGSDPSSILTRLPTRSVNCQSHWKLMYAERLDVHLNTLRSQILTKASRYHYYLSRPWIPSRHG